MVTKTEDNLMFCCAPFFLVSFACQRMGFHPSAVTGAHSQIKMAATKGKLRPRRISSGAHGCIPSDRSNASTSSC